MFRKSKDDILRAQGYKPHWEINEQVAQLKRDGELEKVCLILDACIEYSEKYASQKKRPVYSWPYIQRAIVSRKLKDYDGEISVIQRYARQNSSYSKSSFSMLNRLEKAYQLAGRDPAEGDSLMIQHGLVLDCETTGLTNSDELIEIGAVLFRFNRSNGVILGIEDTYSGLRKPSVPITPAAAAVHGISNRMLWRKSLDNKKVRSMLNESNIIIAHNASFDYRFVTALFNEASNLPWFCTLRGINWSSMGHQSKKLDVLLSAYAISRNRQHRALDDATAVLDLMRLTPKGSQDPLFKTLLLNGASKISAQMENQKAVRR